MGEVDFLWGFLSLGALVVLGDRRGNGNAGGDVAVVAAGSLDVLVRVTFALLLFDAVFAVFLDESAHH